MKKVTNTFYADEVKKESHYYTGLVYELEDGTYYVTSQDGYITPGSIFTKDEFTLQFLTPKKEGK